MILGELTYFCVEKKEKEEKIIIHVQTPTIQQRVTLSRWKMLGHALRNPENSHAQCALCFVVDHMKILPGRRDRHRKKVCLKLLRRHFSEGY